jgi:hypothetical protein
MGCPDKDIDALTVSVMQSWLPGVLDDSRSDEEQLNALQASLEAARDICKLRSLNGAAPVCYGGHA